VGCSRRCLAPAATLLEQDSPTRPAELSPRRKAGIAFVSAITLLTIGGIATAITIWNLIDSLRWLAHSYQVEVALGDVDSMLTEAARARAMYVSSGDNEYYVQFETDVHGLPEAMERIHDLLSDNAPQLALLHQLSSISAKRAALLEQSVELRHEGKVDPESQSSIQKDSITAVLVALCIVARRAAPPRSDGRIDPPAQLACAGNAGRGAPPLLARAARQPGSNPDRREAEHVRADEALSRGLDAV
jgi:CHASE3 domain sensor protein